MPKIMIITVGTGRVRTDIASAICKSIDTHNPDEIIFVVTEKSEKETLPYILSDKKIKDKKCDIVRLLDENDMEEIKDECDKIIKNILKKYNPEDIIIDYTSGTKAMSVGVILAGIENEIGSISYIIGKRDEEGRVISGAEKIISFKPNEIYANKLFSEAIKSFNFYQYDLSIQLLNQAKKLFQEENFVKRIDVLSSLAQVYSNWDKFDLKGAFQLLNNLTENYDLYSEWGIKNKIERHKQILWKEIKYKFCEERIVDLFLNAQRRYKENKYDDAIARLYRLLEYIAQSLIASKNLYVLKENNEPDTSKLDLCKIPGELRSKYQETIGLEKSYELLNDLIDPLGIEIYSELKNKNSDLRKILVIRNNSILAHGFHPVKKESSENMIKILEIYLRKFIENFDYLLKEIDFPQIKTR